MRKLLRLLPAGAWAGLVIVGLGAWAQDIYGVLLGGVLAVVTLVLTDREQGKAPDEDTSEDVSKDERFKDL